MAGDADVIDPSRLRQQADHVYYIAMTEITYVAQREGAVA